jgi:hypothetical protein
MALATAVTVRTAATVLVTVVGAGRTVAMARATAVTVRTATPVLVTVVGVRTVAIIVATMARTAVAAKPIAAVMMATIVPMIHATGTVVDTAATIHPTATHAAA